MKNNFVRLITFVALVSILFLQGIWLYSTYKLLEIEFKKNISNLFIDSLEKEVFLRMEDPAREKEETDGKTVEGFHPMNDPYTNSRAFQDFLYKYYKDDYPVSLEKVDSIFNSRVKDYYKHLNHSLVLTDSFGNKKQNVTFGENNTDNHFAYKETIKLRNIDPEYITLTITSPYNIIFGKMLLMLIASFILAIIVFYGLILQVRMINQQNKTAKMRQDFTHAMIHDMKNPLTTIRTGINTLKTGKIEDKPERKVRYYAIINEECDRLLKLVNKTLETANFEGQKITLKKERINLPDLINDLTEKYQLNPIKPVHFHIDLDGVETIYADLHYTTEVFDNIIDNAIKYSKENEEPEISITASFTAKNAQIKFKDNGIGISADDQKKIFKKFERSMAVINNPKKVSGFGLGLNYVYQVIKAHGGNIDVNSKLGSYSEFIINLPNNENDKTVVN